MRAAALPPPPPYPNPLQFSWLSLHNQMASNGHQYESRSAYNAGDADADGGRRLPRPLMHIKDVWVRAQQGIPHDGSLEKLLMLAQDCLNSAQSSLDFKRPDIAVADFLKANQIIAVLVPSHPDSMILHDRPRLAEQKKMLCKVYKPSTSLQLNC